MDIQLYWSNFGSSTNFTDTAIIFTVLFVSATAWLLYDIYRNFQELCRFPSKIGFAAVGLVYLISYLNTFPGYFAFSECFTMNYCLTGAAHEWKGAFDSLFVAAGLLLFRGPGFVPLVNSIMMVWLAAQSFILLEKYCKYRFGALLVVLLFCNPIALGFAVMHFRDVTFSLLLTMISVLFVNQPTRRNLIGGLTVAAALLRPDGKILLLLVPAVLFFIYELTLKRALLLSAVLFFISISLETSYNSLFKTDFYRNDYVAMTFAGPVSNIVKARGLDSLSPEEQTSYGKFINEENIKSSFNPLQKDLTDSNSLNLKTISDSWPEFRNLSLKLIVLNLPEFIFDRLRYIGYHFFLMDEVLTLQDSYMFRTPPHPLCDRSFGAINGFDSQRQVRDGAAWQFEALQSYFKSDSSILRLMRSYLVPFAFVLLCLLLFRKSRTLAGSALVPLSKFFVVLLIAPSGNYHYLLPVLFYFTVLFPAVFLLIPRPDAPNKV